MKSKLVTCLGNAPVTNTDGQDTSGSHTAGSKTPGGAGHTRQTHEPHKTEPTQNNLKTNPPTDSRARPHPNPGTHASPQTAPLTRSSAVVVMEMWRRRPDEGAARARTLYGIGHACRCEVGETETFNSQTGVGVGPYKHEK